MTALAATQTHEQKQENEAKKLKYLEKTGKNVLESLDTSSTEKIESLRGRHDFDVLGVLRTKPGRIDSEPTLSMSCR